jgi:hypothetical protein
MFLDRRFELEEACLFGRREGYAALDWVRRVQHGIEVIILSRVSPRQNNWWGLPCLWAHGKNALTEWLRARDREQAASGVLFAQFRTAKLSY